jgi:hypothetical protein
LDEIVVNCSSEWEEDSIQKICSNFKPRPPYQVKRDPKGDPSNIPSQGIPLGAIEIAGGEEPIPIGVDGPSSTGYTMIATIISAEVWKIGQSRPNDLTSFRRVEIDECLLRGWWKPVALRRSENRRNLNKGNMSQIRKRIRPFRHTRGSGYPVGSFSRFSSGFLPSHRRNDDEEGIRTKVDLKSTCFRNASPSRRGRIQLRKGNK